MIASAQLDDFPLKTLTQTGTEGNKEVAAQAVEPNRADAEPQSSSIPTTEASYVFRCEGAFWYFRYPGDVPEGKRLPDSMGFQHYARVLAARPNPIESLDVDPAKPGKSPESGSWVKEGDEDTYQERGGENKHRQGEYRKRNEEAERFKRDGAELADV